jgi:hypothetical protein
VFSGTRPIHTGGATLLTGKEILPGLFRTLRSMRLTLTLLLLLAAAAAVGTFLPQGEEGAVFYRSPPFRALLALLCLNMGACLWSRRAVVAGAFRSGRGGARALCSFAGHLCLLLTMGFALAGSVIGWVGTKNSYVGGSFASVYDWGLRGERPLPFEVKVTGLKKDPYPWAVKVGVRRAPSGEERQLVTASVGEAFTIRDLPGRFTLLEFDPRGPKWRFEWERQWSTDLFDEAEGVPGTDLEMVVVSFREFAEERSLAAGVTVLSGGEVLAQQEVSPNHPLSLGGLDLFLTSSGEDRYGAVFVGFQVVSDPFRPWALGFAALFFLAVSGACVLRIREAG